jgi:hypothetical protein
MVLHGFHYIVVYFNKVKCFVNEFIKILQLFATLTRNPC